nr:reverse transcriptase domain-containing protein [Tanacetum cinerariifolium]
PDVAELKDIVKALLLDKKSPNKAHATVKAVEESCVTCGGAHSYQNCSAIDGNVYRGNIQAFISQASNVQLNQKNNQNHFNQNQNRGNDFNHGPVYQSPIFQPSAYKAPAYQAPPPQTQSILKEDSSAYVKADDVFMNSNSASTSSSGTLTSNTIANSRSDLKAITTRSGVSYDGPQIPRPPSFLPKVVESEQEATKDPVTPPNNGSTEDVQPLMSRLKLLKSKSLSLSLSL